MSSACVIGKCFSFCFILFWHCPSLKDARKNINKYIPAAFRDLAIWCIALLINSPTWKDFTHNWHLISLVFIQLHLGINQVNNEYYDALLNRISQIQSDSNTNKAIKTAERHLAEDENVSLSSLIYAFDDDDDDGFDTQVHLPRNKPKPKRRKVSKNWIETSTSLSRGNNLKYLTTFRRQLYVSYSKYHWLFCSLSLCITLSLWKRLERMRK